MISTRRCHLPYIHTYIILKIGHNRLQSRLQLSFSHHLCCVCVHFTHEQRDDRYFEKLLMAISFTLKVFTRNLLRGSQRRNILKILASRRCLTWSLNLGLKFKDPTHYLLGQSDFMVPFTTLRLIPWTNQEKEFVEKLFILFINYNTITHTRT